MTQPPNSCWASLEGWLLATARHGLLTGVQALPAVCAVSAHVMHAGADTT